MRLKICWSQIISILVLCCYSGVLAQNNSAPGAPGKDAQWASAGKQAIGTAANLESKIWFTLQGGALTEVYYPDVTAANVHLLQFVVVNPKTKKVETERDDAIHKIEVVRPDSLSFRQINTAKSGEWKITKTYTADPESDSVLIDVQFEMKKRDLNLYVYYDPSLGNTGMHDYASREFGTDGETTGKLVVQERKSNIASILAFSSGLSEQTNGFYQVSDGLEQLKQEGKIINQYPSAPDGNVVQMARILKPSRFTTVLSFAKGNLVKAVGTSLSSLTKGFAKCQAEYDEGWSDYIKTLPKVDAKYQAQFNMAAMVLKASEDKAVRGANVASLTIPWGGGANANEDVGGGYHLVWSRDLYQVVTAYMALGDTAAANRALDFLFKIQQKPDGSFPQNSWLDGRPSWNSLQLDEVAYPMILAYQLQRFDRDTYQNHVKKAADFIVKTGPKTVQERWEEKSGYSPSTIAAEIAGLVCAAEIAKKNNDEASAAIYLATADDWARNVERWTATTKGKYGDGNYYLRLTENGTPDAGEQSVLNNNAGSFQESEIVDAGFLELVRLGIKSPEDPLIAKSIKIVDEVLKVNTPNGAGFYRYNHDGYGEMDDGRRWNWDGKYTGKGRLWALLSGERGQYELAKANYLQNIASNADEEMRRKGPSCRSCFNDEQIELLHYSRENVIEQNNQLAMARTRLDAMLGFANEGLMIPEQVWDKAETPANIDKQFVPELKFGEGTGSATPLAWSMAQFIRLAVNLKAGKNLETPDVVDNRYVKNIPPSQASFNVQDASDTLMSQREPGTPVRFKVFTNLKNRVFYTLDGVAKEVKPTAGEFSFDVAMPAQETTGCVAVVAPDDSANGIECSKIGGKKTEDKISTELLQKIQNATVSPLIEGDKAIFVYRGAAARVELVGDVTDWQPRGLIFNRSPGNQYLIMPFDRTARVEYKFVLDGKDWINDLLNPESVDNGGGGRNSVLIMPAYKPSALAFGEASKLDEFEVIGKNFGTRKIKVYLPEIYNNSNTPLPVLYVQDGSEYFSRASAATVQVDLLRANKIKPFILVFIDPQDRMKDYWANDAWADFVANEIVPAVDAKYRTVKNRDGRALLGASLGGVTSVWTALKHPEAFARVGGQSASFWIDDERVVKELAKLDSKKTPFKFYFDVGTLEGAADDRRVNLLLRGKGYPVVYRETASGHNWTAWRDRLADAYIALWAN